MLTKKKLIFQFLRSCPLLLSAAFITGLFNGITTLLIPVFTGKYFQDVLGTHSIRGKFFDELIPGTRDVYVFFTFFLVIITLKAVFTFIHKYLTGYGSEIFSKKLREDLLAKQLSFALNVHERKPSGKYLLRYSGDLNAIQRYISGGIITFSTDILFLIMTVSFLFYLQKDLALILLLIFIPAFVTIWIVNRKLKMFTLRRRNIRSENLNFVATRLSALTTVKVFNREKTENEKFEKNSAKLFNYGIEYYRWYAFMHSLFPYFLYLMLMTLMGYVYYIKTRQNIPVSAATLIIFFMVLISLLPALKRVLRVNMIWQAGDISFQKVIGIFNSPEETRSNEHLMMEEPGPVTFSNVTFGYNINKPVLNNISFRASPYQITMIKGEQGSGKSTVFKLLLGLYRCNSGSITINETDISSISTYSLRKKTTLVSEDLPLLGKTIFESVSYSRKIEKRIPAENMLRKLKFGLRGEEALDLDYQVEDQGKNLSRGQRKILMITRALLTRKKILLLDEPFSGLDEPARENLVKQLNNLKKKRTIIIAGHHETEGLLYDQIIQI